MSQPLVCIVTPIHDGIDSTVRFLESAQRLSYENVEIIIVDDGSTDGSREIVRRNFPDTTIIQGDGSLWWTAATNLGVKEALSRGAEFVYTVNNDVVMEPEAISESVSCALRNRRALVGSTVWFLEDPERLWFAGGKMDPKTGDIEHIQTPISDPSGIRRSELLTGMGMLIPAEAFREIGMFDDKAFPHYMADCDYSLRAAGRGYELLVTSDSRIHNEVGSAWSVRQMRDPTLRFLMQMIFSKRSAYWIVGRVRFYRRHWGAGRWRALWRVYLKCLRFAAPGLARYLRPDRRRD